MKKALVTTLLASVFIGALVISSAAATGHKTHHPDGVQPPTSSQSMPGMMGMAKMMQHFQGLMKGGLYNQMDADSGMMGSGMMGSGMMGSGMMGSGMMGSGMMGSGMMGSGMMGSGMMGSGMMGSRMMGSGMMGSGMMGSGMMGSGI